MRIIRTLIAGSLAVFALSAIVASAAQAGEYGRCVKVKVAETGKYKDNACTEEEATPKGEYEWEAGPGLKPGYISTTGVAVLESADGNVECQKSTDIGEITGVKTDVDTVTFEECVIKGSTVNCQNIGGATGIIKTYLLDTSLIDHGEKGLSGLEPEEGEVWTQFVSPSGPTGFQAEFECVGVWIRVSGSISAVTTPVNKMTTAFKLKFAKKKGEQDLIVEDSLNEGKTWGKPVTATELPEKATVTTEEKSEIRACNANIGEPPPVCS